MGGAFKTTPAKAALKKKRGTASVIKAPKRSRGGGRGGGGGIGRRGRSGGGRKKSIGGGGEGGSSPGPSSSMVGNSSGAESDSGPYCLCRGPDDHKFMIACDRCEDWFHGACIGMDKYTGEVLVQKYICPNCRVDGLYLTRYKKMCSLEGCDQPARIYNPEDRSIFCTEEHCQQWWEQLIATLPKSKKGDSGGSLEVLTQEEFMGLLGPPGKGNKDAWKLSKKPFGVPKDFWETVDCNRALTDEERHMLETSAAERYALGEEMVLCKKMLQLLEMATKRREAAIAAGRGTTKDLCGYDIRLDTIGVAHQFSVFLQSPQGEAIFKAGRLDAPSPSELAAATAAVATNNNEITRTGGAGGYENGIKEADPLTAGMCIKKKCKPHAQWGVILTKDVRHAIKELAAQAKEKLDTEERVRESAASRFARKSRESSSAVTVCRGESESAGDYGSGDGDDETMDDDGDDEGDDGAAAENRGDEVMT
ncbi:hypothetical protein B0H63DRAFT_496729 [Podospora didyma]|uniref:PHD-type domain-containing protein n=1 Tax=Podospora didyma TaxID=330526 RepID=A0AAE0K9H4_9PEZI|nr:hypothetical protein B0H63DRAFT_496729 [Podospora didyma]